MFLSFPQLLIFLSATVVLNLIPGADVMYIASQSLRHKKQGILAALGISTGIAVYVAATASGLMVILKTSAWVFNFIKFIGAFYLLYLAWQAFTAPPLDEKLKNGKLVPDFQAYRKGIFTTLANPKVGLFFLTFLPQFVDVTHGKVGLQFLILGGVFIISGTFINLMYVFLFSYLRKHIFSKDYIRCWLNKITALLFVGLACKVLLAKQ